MCDSGAPTQRASSERGQLFPRFVGSYEIGRSCQGGGQSGWKRVTRSKSSPVGRGPTVSVAQSNTRLRQTAACDGERPLVNRKR
jgi:hypothetical protein